MGKGCCRFQGRVLAHSNFLCEFTNAADAQCVLEETEQTRSIWKIGEVKFSHHSSNLKEEFVIVMLMYSDSFS